jgi:hypothetical protein
MKIFTFLLLLLASIVSACSDGNIIEQDYTIQYGSSFGMCIGDCVQELSVTKEKAVLKVLKRTGNGQQEDLEVRNSKALSNEEYTAINQLINVNTIQALPEVIGCPDCTDGGAAWIEISGNEIQKKVTFEYYQVPEKLKELVERLRALQEELYVEKDD